MIAAILLSFLIQVAGDSPLSNPRLEERAQAMMREIRCVVCENEPVSQSTADIAIDMRRAIRRMIEDGKSDDEVRHFFTDKYGGHVSFRPPTEGFGILLWAFPFLLLAGVGGWLGYRAFSHRNRNLAPIPEDGRPPE